jgi:hypothetical protein
MAPGKREVISILVLYVFAPPARYGWQPTGLAGVPVLPPDGVDVPAGGEQLPEEVDLHIRW